MISLVLCFVVLAASYLTARRSLVYGLCVLMAVGYGYGIFRANHLDRYSHLLFDASLLGVYAAHFSKPWTIQERLRLDELRLWLIVLIGWPVILFLAPQQDWLVELVGLRGNVFMLPCLLLGARLTRDDIYALACWLAVLNLGAAVVAGAQFAFGIEPFFPHNAVTEIIYRSGDVAGSTAHRIPSVFTSAHAYGGTMMLTIPLLVAAWLRTTDRRWISILLASATTVSAIAIFATGARQPVLQLVAIGGVALFSSKVRVSHRLRWIVVAAVVAYTVSSAERLQRFLTLRDVGFVTERIAGSVNLGFLEMASQYPLGNGLGGGGTSIPYFLLDRVRNVVAMENEYARILLEQGIPGVMAWALFIAWLLSRHPPSDPSWHLGRRLIRVAGATSFATGLIGTGLLTSIPGTAILMCSMGWVAVPDRAPESSRSALATLPSAVNWQHGSP